MADLEINVISRETIPPSSPTPNHLKTYKLSYLDQMHLPVYIARVLFYGYNQDTPFTNHEKLNRLKQSLPQVLTQFYPLAGRFAGGTCDTVNCNDEGVVFVEASANVNLLHHIIYDPIPSEFTKFIPYNKDDELKDHHPLVIQATFFECGGLALGAGISHRIADAWSFFMFVNSWASVSLGNDIVSPSFNCTTLFPPPNDCVSFKPSYWDVNEDNIRTERFVFSATNLSALREKYTTRNSIIPTRIEALSAFIWDRFMASSTTQQKDNDPSSTKVYIIKHTINLRGKVVPAIPDNAFGNIMWVSNAIVVGRGGDNITTTTTTTERIRQAIQNVGGDQETTLRELNESMKNGEGEKGYEDDEVVPLVFSSTCRFPIEKSDFGWGKADWVGSANLPHRNVIYLLDSISGKGIEAWINLKSEDMLKFEVDEELLQYVTLVHDAHVCW